MDRVFMAIERSALPKQVVHTDFGAALAMISDGEVSEERPPRWAAFSHRFEAPELAIGNRWTQLSGLILDEASAARALRNAARTTTLRFLSSISSATARREKAPDD
jgi:hypothetical protein